MKKVRIVSVLISALIVGIIVGVLAPNAKKELTNNDQMSVDNMFDIKDHFYVLFARDDCRYCENIENDIDNLSKKANVYVVDPELCKKIKSYDWDAHELKYDVEIGEMQDDGNILFYHDMTEKNIKEKYPPIDYKIVLVNDRYAELHEGKEVGKIYAIYTHPVLDETDLTVDNFCVPAIPMLIEFDQNKVVNYYFDDKEIIAYLNSDTEPLDKYWNLE